MDAGLMGQIASGAQQAGGKVTGIVPRKLQDSEMYFKRSDRNRPGRGFVAAQKENVRTG